MIKDGRPGLAEEQKADMWRRWKAGYSIREICEALKRSSSPVYQQLAIRGGIAPSGRIRAVVLKMAEREEISRGLGSGESVRSIARRLARSPSTVSREVARHGGRTRYRANHADYEASLSALRPKPCRLALNGRLRKVVASRLALEWSPEQISGWLKIQYPGDELRFNASQISRIEQPAFHLRHMSAFCSSVRPGRPSFSIVHHLLLPC